MKVAYFPGCCYETSAKEYDLSARLVCKHLGIELVEVPDWNCCGSTAAHSTDRLLALALAGRNLALVERMGLTVAAPCAACYQRLALARVELAGDECVRQKVNELTGYAYRGSAQVKSILEVIADLGEEKVKALVKKPLHGLRVAAYYGCLLLRPAEVQIDDPENPQLMDRVLRWTGAEAVDWTHKAECCGASLAVSNEDVVLPMVARILRAARLSGADCLATACAMCHFNLDLRQPKVSRVFGERYHLPVFYFTQLLGLAMGLSRKETNVHKHIVNTRPLLTRVLGEER